MLSQFGFDPRQRHMDAEIKVLRYIKTTPRQGIYIANKVVLISLHIVMSISMVVHTRGDHAPKTYYF